MTWALSDAASFLPGPGGAHLAGARLIYPNHADEPPGTRFKFWNYDPEERGWYVYGHGTVTAAGRQVVPDPGVTLYEFTGRDGGRPR
jgi:hypothetical protein